MQALELELMLKLTQMQTRTKDVGVKGILIQNIRTIRTQNKTENQY